MLINRIPRSNRYFDAYQIVVMLLFHWGLVNTGGSWRDVGSVFRAELEWVLRDGFVDGKWVDVGTTLAGRGKEYEGEDSGFDESGTLRKRPAANENNQHLVGKNSKVDGADNGSKGPQHRDLAFYVRGFLRLFFTKKFAAHRLIGLAFLVQYIVLVVSYLVDYDKYFRNSVLLTTMPITGIAQTITAIVTFTFLPKKKDGGYVNDVGAISYFFVVEN
ncbi:hypothetical protein HDU93_003805, partial [Gonapodya sp. JEL0774]